MTNSAYQFLEQQILEFMSVIEECLKSTSYADDRPVYLKDMAKAASWLIRLHKKVSPPLEIAQEIISTQTDKYFVDYWRQGEWGDREAKALKNLQEEIQKHYSLS